MVIVTLTVAMLARKPKKFRERPQNSNGKNYRTQSEPSQNPTF